MTIKPSSGTKLLIAFVCCISFSFPAHAQNYQRVFISDIDNFWIAYDSIQPIKDTTRQIQLMQELYIDKGTDGLKLYMKVRNFDARRLVENINTHPRFWKSIRPNTLKIKPQQPAIETNIQQLKALYPPLRPAKIYFTIGATRSAGTTIDSMALIGSEITMGNKYTDVSEFPDKRLANFFKTQSTDNIVPVTIHEYVHTQQSTEGKVLLGECIYEGACDFITELVLGKPLNHGYLVYGRAHEKELKQQFQKEMYVDSFSNWLYNGATAKAIGDLGYFMGYTICKAYYQQAKNKQLAIQKIIQLNYADLPAIKQFLAESKYYK